MDLIIPQKPKGFKKMSTIFGNGRNTNSRNSRDVWNYLEAKQEFSQWIKTRISQVGAEENIDFVVAKNNDGRFTNIDYVVTDDFAKHLGMLEKTPKGKEVRNYFIYMEKLARYLIEKKMQDCMITIDKKETKLLNQITQLKEKSYAKTRSGDYQVVDRIRQDYKIACSSEYLNSLLVGQGFMEVEYHQVKRYISCSPDIKDGITPTVFVKTLLDIVDDMDIPRGLGHEDTNQRLF